MGTYTKPLPTPDAETEAFWQGTKEHKLLIQRCSQCASYRFYPRLICPQCMSDQAEWVASSGRGRIYSFTVVHRAPSEAFKAEVPYVLAVVELAEGVRMMTTLVGSPPAAVQIDLPVEVLFEDCTEEITLPKFRLS